MIDLVISKYLYKCIQYYTDPYKRSCVHSRIQPHVKVTSLCLLENIKKVHLSKQHELLICD